MALSITLLPTALQLAQQEGVVRPAQERRAALGGGEQCHSKSCVEGGSSVIVVLVPRAFQKYSTCMVYSDFLLPGPSVFVFVFVFVFVYLHV